MSYILDALRKADVQRERSRAPGLHDQSIAGAADERAPGWGRAPLLWAAAGIGALSIVLVGWQMVQAPDLAEREAAAAPAAVAATAASVAEPAPAVIATAVVPPPPEPRPEPRPQARPAPAHAAAAAPAASASASASPAPAQATASAPAQAAASAPAPAEIGPVPPGAPKLAISGGVYSHSPTQRMLIVGGQVFNEGSEVAPGVRLEQVRPNQAVLSWHGQRYAVAF